MTRMDNPQLQELVEAPMERLDINPFLIRPDGALALGAVLVTRPPQPATGLLPQPAAHLPPPPVMFRPRDR